MFTCMYKHKVITLKQVIQFNNFESKNFSWKRNKKKTYLLTEANWTIRKLVDLFCRVKFQEPTKSK